MALNRAFAAIDTKMLRCISGAARMIAFQMRMSAIDMGLYPSCKNSEQSGSLFTTEKIELIRCTRADSATELDKDLRRKRSGLQYDEI